MLGANRLHLETGGVTVRDSAFNCGARFFVGNAASTQLQLGTSEPWKLPPGLKESSVSAQVLPTRDSITCLLSSAAWKKKTAH
jgi:hypothetical protein